MADDSFRSPRGILPDAQPIKAARERGASFALRGFDPQASRKQTDSLMQIRQSETGCGSFHDSITIESTPSSSKIMSTARHATTMANSRLSATSKV
jgi:hypothetical protein